MTQITKDDVEWAVVDRLRLMLEEPPHKAYNVTQTYALFTTVLCWVMERIRNKKFATKDDKLAAGVWETLSGQRIAEEPWAIWSASSEKIVRIGSCMIHVPAPINFDGHMVDRFLINLRDAAAHGDARKIKPFVIEAQRLLAGFTFHCSEEKKGATGEARSRCSKMTCGG